MEALLKHEGLVRTDLHCHACNKGFIAQLNYSIDGNNCIQCPHCGHLHYRRIKEGKVTDDRYDSDPNTNFVEKRYVWKAHSQPITTSVAHAFLRDRWLSSDEF